MTTAYPLQWPAGWPRTSPEDQSTGHQFRQKDHGSKWSGTKLVTFPVARDKLYEELQKLGAINVVVSTNHTPDKYGIPVERSRVADHGVAIYFQLKGRSMAMACDRFEGAAANMRSLGLAIEAMRQLERHGGGYMMEKAFSGFTALPAPDQKIHWSVLLGLRRETATVSEIDVAYKKLAMQYHQDGHDLTALNVARDEAKAEKSR